MRNTDYLPAKILQIAGLLLLVAFAVIWWRTGRESELFVGAALLLIGIGAYSRAQEELRRVGRSLYQGYKEGPRDESK